MSGLTTATAIALAAGALLVPACGGGGDEGLSREEFISRGDAICDEYDQRTEQVEDPESLDDVERFVEETRTLIRDGVDELKELEPPEELADDYNRWTSQIEENIGLLDDLEAAAAAGDEAQVQEILAEAEQAGAQADRLAGEMGFEECGAND
jgi:hypothetical protein